MKNIRIWFVGDEGVGKTSIISTIMSESFPKNPPKKIPPVCMPPDIFLQYRQINTLLLDTSPDTVEEEIKKASAVLLVYDVNISETMHRLETYWLPKIADINDSVPVIIVGNKIDIRPSQFNNELEGLVTPLVMKFKQVEMGIEWSAKAYLKLIDVVYCAQRTVMFPITPLQDAITKELTVDFEKALLRIFRIWDKDCDGYLDEGEIADLNANVFNGELQSGHIEGLKEFLILEWGEDRYSREDAKKGINFEAFKQLQIIYIRKRKLQTCWLILEFYGYNDKLRISDEHRVPTKVKEDETNESWEGLELTQSTIEFLEKLHDIHSSHDGNLYQKDIDELFQTYPDDCPWDISNETVVDNHGWISKKNWIGLWQREFNTDYEKAFEMIVYLGHILGFYDTVNVKINRRIFSINKPSKSTVFNCYVIGDENVGKSEFLNMVIKQKFSDEFEDLNPLSIVANIPFNGIDRYLILHNIQHKNLEQLFEDERKLQYCDWLCIMYDGSDTSANFIKKISGRFPNRIPKVIIRTKEDLVSKSNTIAIEEIADEVKTTQFIEISNKNVAKVKTAVDLILDTSINPSKGLDIAIVEKLQEELAAQQNKEKNKILILSLTAIVATGAAAYAAYQNGWFNKIMQMFK